MTDFVEIPADQRSLSSRKLVCGVGVNDADYFTQVKVGGRKQVCNYYRTWTNMLIRCYSSKVQDKRPTYVGCSVCSEWLLFSGFKKWMLSQDWRGKQLDKDLLSFGNKIYSPKFCVFVPPLVNSLLTDHGSARGDYPQGVSLDNGRYKASISIHGKLKNLGRYSDIKDAERAYLLSKSEYVRSIAKDQDDTVMDALNKIAIAMESKAWKLS